MTVLHLHDPVVITISIAMVILLSITTVIMTTEIFSAMPSEGPLGPHLLKTATPHVTTTKITSSSARGPPWVFIWARLGEGIRVVSKFSSQTNEWINKQRHEHAGSLLIFR